MLHVVGDLVYGLRFEKFRVCDSGKLLTQLKVLRVTVSVLYFVFCIQLLIVALFMRSDVLFLKNCGMSRFHISVFGFYFLVDLLLLIPLRLSLQRLPPWVYFGYLQLLPFLQRCLPINGYGFLLNTCVSLFCF